MKPHKNLIAEIIMAAKEVHQTLGDGFLEQVYEEAMYHELAARGIPSVMQYNIDVVYKGITLQKRYIPDLYVDNKILVEIKSVKDIAVIEEAQLLNYLKVANVRAGLLINFGAKLAVKRRIWTGATGTPTTGTPADPEKMRQRNNPEPM